MKHLSLIFILILFLGCNKTKDNKELNITCERIIVQYLGSKEGEPSINFLISYKNLGNQDVLLFANSIHKSLHEPYDSIGLTLTFQNQMTPIGAFGEGSFFIVKPNSTKRLLYTYSPIYNNIWFLGGSNPFTKKEDARKIVDKISLKYRFDRLLAKKMIEKNKLEVSEKLFYDKSIDVKINQIPIEYRESISAEEAIDMIEGLKTDKRYEMTNDTY